MARRPDGETFMRIGIFCAAALILFTAPHIAFADATDSVRDLMVECNSNDKEEQQKCLNLVALNTLDEVSGVCFPKPFNGYVVYPEIVSRLKDITSKNPALLDGNYDQVINTAMRSAYPCPVKSN